MDSDTIENYPWPHWIIDNFLDEEDFNIIRTEALDILKTIDVTNSPSPIEKNHGIYIVRKSEDKQWPEIVKKYERRLIKFKDAGLPIRKHEQLVFKSNITFAGPGANYPCHYEVPTKIFATTTYLYPDVSVGTKLYMRDKSYFAPVHAKTVDWAPNKTCCFIPQDDITWHSYDNPFRKTRIVLLMGFVDKGRQTNFYENSPDVL